MILLIFNLLDFRFIEPSRFNCKDLFSFLFEIKYLRLILLLLSKEEEYIIMETLISMLEKEYTIMERLISMLEKEIK